MRAQPEARLARAREHGPHLDSLAGHVTGFAKILTGLHGGRPGSQVTAVNAGGQPGPRSVTRGTENGHAAFPLPGKRVLLG